MKGGKGQEGWGASKGGKGGGGEGGKGGEGMSREMRLELNRRWARDGVDGDRGYSPFRVGSIKGERRMKDVIMEVEAKLLNEGWGVHWEGYNQGAFLQGGASEG